MTRFSYCARAALMTLALISAPGGHGQARADQAPLGATPLNAIQVIGTHNSYHAGLGANEMAFYRAMHAPEIDTLDYHHRALTTQLDTGIRQVELDVFADPAGGRYDDPAGRHWAAAAGFPPAEPFDPQGAMTRPGFKVLHIQDIDYHSTCEPLTACLAEIRAWSQAHPGHDPLFVLIEAKDDPLHVARPTVTPLSMTPALFDALDAEIRAVFPADALFTPDDLRRDAPSLPAAIRRFGWPRLDALRGKTIFLLDRRRQEKTYTDGHPALRGRVLFTNATPGAPDAAFVEENDPRSGRIPALIAQGYLVRTRADDGGQEARADDPRRRDAALASGAQIVSTDYPAGEPAPSGYVVALPGGAGIRLAPRR